MAGVNSIAKVEELTISAVRTRRDGTTEDLGVISYRSSSRFKTFLWYLRQPRQMRHKVCKFLRGS